MATEAFEKGFLEARLSGQQADLVWGVMQMAKCTPEEALRYLLSIAEHELASGTWDGSTAAGGGSEGVQVSQTNLHLITKFKEGDLVVIEDGNGLLIGTVEAIGGNLARVALTPGSVKRRGGSHYTAHTRELQEL
jgi:hypothetical protein